MLTTSSSPRGRGEAEKVASVDAAKSDGEDDFLEGDAGRIRFRRLKKEVQDLRTQVRKGTEDKGDDDYLFFRLSLEENLY